MALDYGKMEFAVSFKPITAFPLDSRSYYESLAAAEAAAATAVEAGSDQGTIYFGQTLVVVENGAAQMLQVQPNGTLSEIGGKIEIDEHQFTIDKTTGKLNLFGFANAVAGAQPVIEEVEVEGEKVKQLKWVKPDTTTVDGLATAIADLETAQEALEKKVTANETAITGLSAKVDEKANSADVYTKTETNALLDNKANSTDVYTKNETDTAIAAAVTKADHLKRKIVANKTAIETYINDHDDAEQYIFMVPTVYEYTQESNKYDEYIVLSFGEGEEKFYTIEPVGSWSVDLEDYVSETELTDYLKSYYTSDKVDKLLEAYATISTLETEFEKYYTIQQLNALLTGYYDKEDIDGLLADIYSKSDIDNKFTGYYTKTETDNLLNGKANKVEGKSLVSDTEIAKLATVKENAEANFIKSVSSNFNVTEAGQLHLNTLDIENINGLKTTLDEKVNKEYYTVPVFDEDGNPVIGEDGVTPVTKQVEGTLLSPEDQEKLAALVIGDEGVQISGKVNADNVEGLASWVTKNRSSVPGLLSVDQQNHLEAVEKNFINSVDTSTFEVTSDRKLLLKELPVDAVAGLSELTATVGNLDAILNGYTDKENNKVQGLVETINNFESTYVSILDFNSAVGDLSTLFESGTTLVERIDELDQRLKWQDMKE